MLAPLCVNGSVFESCLLPPANNQTFVQPQDVTPLAGSNAIGAALPLPNVNDGYSGSGPSICAAEIACVQPIFGPRPLGLDESKTYTCNGYQ